jgi:hypothetical protein
VYISTIYVLVTGPSTEEHVANLERVLQRLEAAEMRLKKEKCVFLAPEVEYLGYKISKRGIEPTDEKVSFAPRPGNVAELRAFLGLISRFLPNLATVLNPLYRLLHKEVDWSWEESHEEAFRAAKELLKSSKVLTHFYSLKDVVLTADVSPYGVGAMLSHCLEDGTEHPTAYTSRPRNKTTHT